MQLEAIASHPIVSCSGAGSCEAACRDTGLSRFCKLGFVSSSSHPGQKEELLSLSQLKGKLQGQPVCQSRAQRKHNQTAPLAANPAFKKSFGCVTSYQRHTGLGSASAASCTHRVLVWWPGRHRRGQVAACGRDPGCPCSPDDSSHRAPRQLLAPGTGGPVSPGAAGAVPTGGCQTRGAGGTLAARATPSRPRQGSKGRVRSQRSQTRSGTDPHPAPGKRLLPAPETVPWPHSLHPSPSRTR